MGLYFKIIRFSVYLIVIISAAILSCIMFYMPGRSYEGRVTSLAPRDITLKDNLSAHVKALSVSIGERNHAKYDNLNRACGYIINSLSSMGYAPVVQEYTAGGLTFKNISAEIKGGSLPDEIVIIGAHYDTAYGTPGANDNATGVAAVIELARLLKERRLNRTVRFALFSNEEPPYFQTEYMGSLVYAKAARQKGENIVAMISLETIGYFNDDENSQSYPFPFSLIYPDRGNFMAFVGDLGSAGLVRKSIKSFRGRALIPSEGLVAPRWITGVGWSDHWSFWQAGYRAVMITDTAIFRYPHYHSPEDTIDKIDFNRLSPAVSAMADVVTDAAAR